MSNTRGKITTFLLVSQIAFIILFGLLAEYDAEHAGPRTTKDAPLQDELFASLYPMFQDVHVMMLVGFGFLMTFLKRHGFGSVGFNFLLTCYVIQWSLLINGWFEGAGGTSTRIHLSLESFLHADFAVATVLISFGAILGVASPLQLLVMATLEVIFYNVAIYVGVIRFAVVDVGGSIFIHAFGAYFGLAVAFVLGKFAPNQHHKEESEYHSDLFAMIGTVFLWLFWPSFNAGPANGPERHRAVINTILSLSACTCVTFALSAVVDRRNKLNMVHIQNAAIAGGVAMGASADLIVHPYGALITGSLAALVSVLGYQYLQPLLQRRFNLHDTCGVHNLHGMPGILGAVLSAIFCAVATPESYQHSFGELFGDRTSAGEQAGYQVAALAVALVIALVGGSLTGLFMALPFWDRLDKHELYEDSVFWQCEELDDRDEEEMTAKKQKKHLMPKEVMVTTVNGADDGASTTNQA